MLEKKCEVCKGSGKIEALESECPFCNGTGEYSKAGDSYMKSHICQCVAYDRKNCPLCEKKCHHNTPNRPRLLVGGGYE
jgi:RecJ-like exonuclease